MKIVKRIFLSILVLFIVGFAYTAFLVFSGKFVVGDLAMMMNMNGIDTPEQSVVQQQLQVPKGYTLTMWVRDFPGVRMLRITAAGDLLASRPRSGEVVLILADRNGDGWPDGQKVLLSGLSRPHGIDLYQDWLYVAESNAVGRIHFDAANGKVIGDYQQILKGIGDEGAHWTKSLLIAADGWVYLSSGSTSNVVIDTDLHRGAVSRMRLDGSDYQIFASGLRNSVGLDFNPADNQLYATENGRDLIGDDIPPEEFNRIEENGFYGFPYRFGNNEKDPEFGSQGGQLALNAKPPVHAFRAHNAPLGVHFLRQAIPNYPKNTALVALHGSWNRSVPDGYQVVALRPQPNGSFVEEPFLSGFRKDGNVIGRPVDVAQGPDSSIYVSDDYAGAIYRIAESSAAVQTAATPIQQVQKNTDIKNTNAVKPSAELLAQAEQTWQRYGCSQCHGASPGDPGLKVLKDLNKRYDQSSLTGFFLAPTPPMPRFPLTDTEREALAVWLLQSK